MRLMDPPLSTVFRRRENDGEPVNDRRLRASIAAGKISRIARGVYVDARQWRELTPIDRHAQRVWEAAARSRSQLCISHWAAAALHGIDILGAWPELVDVSVDTASGGRSSGAIRRHTRRRDAVDTMSWGPHVVTTPLQTAVDLAASLPLVEAVAVADQALWGKRTGGALVEASALRHAAHSRTGRGCARAVRAADFATPLADSVRESQSRVLIRAMGFPAPRLQEHFVMSDGSNVFTDFYWLEHRHIGEFDGAGKYVDPRWLRGRSPDHVLLAEKDREDELRRRCDAFSRWRTPALRSPRVLYDILHGAGLPTSRPRPAR